MQEVIDKSMALSMLGSYYDLLAATGYVKHPAVERFIIYTFITDFVECLYDYIDEDDYALLVQALNMLFSHGCCLMPYYVGPPHYTGHYGVRITEEDEDDRITQDEILRMV